MKNNNLKLIKPSYTYRKSYLQVLDEFDEERPFGILYGDLARKNFKQYLKLIRDMEKGIGLKRGWVPASEFWLVRENEFIGAVSFRHKLNKKLRLYGGHIGYSIRPDERKKGYGTEMLALTLKRVKKTGLKKVMITCDENNVGSRKIIETNGGVLEDIIQTDLNEHNKNTMRWWINL
jgi:predicted acetyltransferase